MPIARIEREVYARHSEENGGAAVRMRYTGKGLRREETLSYERYSDWQVGHRVRTSDDNGRTWSDRVLLHDEFPSQGGFSKEEGPFAWCHDPVSDRSVQIVFRRILIGKGNEAIEKFWNTNEQTFFDHNFWQVSNDDGRTWGRMHMLRYEEGPDFNADDWGDGAFLRTNQIYGGYAVIPTREGTIVYPAAGAPLEITDRGAKETVEAVLCFIGKWNRAEDTYDWEVSDPIHVPHRVSGRGLEEPAIAELADGRLLLVMRGSNVVFPRNWEGKVENGGHKWMSISEDGGRTWSAVTDLRYETGEQFYSPGAYAWLLRHSRTGKLYCLLNISPTPTLGNGPRYPLYIAEVEESIPALRKGTLTVIERPEPTDTPEIQFSNFSVLENRQSGEIELYMTRYGERADWRMADAYKYTITLL